MNRDEIVSKIAKNIQENFEINSTDPITGKTNFLEIGLNSFDIIKIIVFCEGEYGISFENDKLVTTYYETIDDMVDYVESLIAKKN